MVREEGLGEVIGVLRVLGRGRGQQLVLLLVIALLTVRQRDRCHL